MKEATTRTKINKPLGTAGWRFFADESGPANIQLEPSVKLRPQNLGPGENFEKIVKSFIDFLLLGAKGFPFIVHAAKAEDKNPLVGKEQARETVIDKENRDDWRKAEILVTTVQSLLFNNKYQSQFS